MFVLRTGYKIIFIKYFDPIDPDLSNHTAIFIVGHS